MPSAEIVLGKTATMPTSRTRRSVGRTLDEVAELLAPAASACHGPNTRTVLVLHRLAERMHEAVRPAENGGGQNKVETLQLVEPDVGQRLRVR